MSWTKTKLVSAMVLALLVVGTGAGALALLLAVETPAGQKQGSPQPAARGNDPDRGGKAKLEDTVLALEKKAWEALKKGDGATLKKLTADDFVAVIEDGSRWTREEMLKELADLRVARYTLKDVKVIRLTPDAAIVTYRLTYVTAADEGPGETKKLTASSAWARRGGQWVNVFYQETLAEDD